MYSPQLIALLFRNGEVAARLSAPAGGGVGVGVGAGVLPTIETCPAPPGYTPGVGRAGSTNESVIEPPVPADDALLIGRTCRFCPKLTVHTEPWTAPAERQGEPWAGPDLATSVTVAPSLPE